MLFRAIIPELHSKACDYLYKLFMKTNILVSIRLASTCGTKISQLVNQETCCPPPLALHNMQLKSWTCDSLSFF